MTVLMISYDLNDHERPETYAEVKKMIESKGTSCIKALYSQWFVETSESVDTWDQHMKAVTDANDRWFINEVTRPRAGWLNKAVWEWLNART